MSGSPRLVSPVGARDHVRGSAEAPVILLEYGDFECPHCANAYPGVKDLHRRFGDGLRFVFRHFPLTNVHPHAQAAAEASEWAATQGAFWPLHDRIYEQQQELVEGRLMGLVERLGLDVAALGRALDAHTYFTRVKEDFLDGIESGVKGTPAFFLEGVLHQGDLDSLAADIERRLARRPA
jgi:protein-disulfide isomerase